MFHVEPAELKARCFTWNPDCSGSGSLGPRRDAPAERAAGTRREARRWAESVRLRRPGLGTHWRAPPAGPSAAWPGTPFLGDRDGGRAVPRARERRGRLRELRTSTPSVDRVDQTVRWTSGQRGETANPVASLSGTVADPAPLLPTCVGHCGLPVAGPVGSGTTSPRLRRAGRCGGAVSRGTRTRLRLHHRSPSDADVSPSGFEPPAMLPFRPASDGGTRRKVVRSLRRPAAAGTACSRSSSHAMRSDRPRFFCQDRPEPTAPGSVAGSRMRVGRHSPTDPQTDGLPDGGLPQGSSTVVWSPSRASHRGRLRCAHSDRAGLEVVVGEPLYRRRAHATERRGVRPASEGRHRASAEPSAIASVLGGLHEAL